MKFKNWFWGFFFLAMAIMIIANPTGVFGEIGFWSVLTTVLLVSIFIDSVTKLNYFGIFVSAAFLYTIYQKPFSLPDISMWLLLLAAIFASIGFQIIFHKRSRKWNCLNSGMDCSNRHDENLDGNKLYAKVTFAESSKYLHSDNLQKGEFTVSFGQLNIYLDQVKISPDGADLNLDCSFGELGLYIPKTWRVKDNLHASLGSIENRGQQATEDNAPIVTLNGGARLGSINITYI